MNSAKLSYFAAVVLASGLWPASASDHADPISFPNVMELFDDGKPSPAAAAKLAGGITDLFVFPLDEHGHRLDFLPAAGEAPAADPSLSEEQNKHRADFTRLTPEQRAQRGMPYELSATEQGRIKSLAVIFCVRRALTKAAKLKLEPYTYAVHLDLHSRVLFNARQDATNFKSAELARYGGSIPEPDKITSDVTLEFRLNDDATLRSFTALGKDLSNKEKIKTFTGIRDDPFIFPAFYSTDVVAMVAIIPIDCFPQGQQDWLAWGTTSKGGKQIDHVGRSLRTQNPRFELLNTIPPSQHVAAIKKSFSEPSLMADVALKFNVQGMFQHRPWDDAPDVMIYSRQFNVGFPNGRRLTDDVAALLAQNGDTLLYELSYLGDKWPRLTTNDKEFLPEFPFLAEPQNTAAPKPGYKLSSRNKLIIAGLLAGVILILLFAVFGLWQFIKMLFGKRQFPG